MFPDMKITLQGNGPFYTAAGRRAELKGISAGLPLGYVPDVNVIVLSSLWSREPRAKMTVSVSG